MYKKSRQHAHGYDWLSDSKRTLTCDDDVTTAVMGMIADDQIQNVQWFADSLVIWHFLLDLKSQSWEKCYLLLLMD